QVHRRPRILPDPLGTQPHLCLDPALPRADRSRSGRGGISRHHSSGRLLRLSRNLCLDADEESDRRRDRDLRFSRAHFFDRVARLPDSRSLESREVELREYVGSSRGIRARGRGHSAARLLRVRHRSFPVSCDRLARRQEGNAVSAPRTTRLGTTTIGIILAVAVFAGVNYLAARHWARGDWTRTKIYSLSETS